MHWNVFNEMKHSRSKQQAPVIYRLIIFSILPVYGKCNFFFVPIIYTIFMEMSHRKVYNISK